MRITCGRDGGKGRHLLRQHLLKPRFVLLDDEQQVPHRAFSPIRNDIGFEFGPAGRPSAAEAGYFLGALRGAEAPLFHVTARLQPPFQSAMAAAPPVVTWEVPPLAGENASVRDDAIHRWCQANSIPSGSVRWCQASAFFAEGWGPRVGLGSVSRLIRGRTAGSSPGFQPDSE